MHRRPELTPDWTAITMATAETVAIINGLSPINLVLYTLCGRGKNVFSAYSRSSNALGNVVSDQTASIEPSRVRSKSGRFAIARCSTKHQPPQLFLFSVPVIS